MYMISWMAIWYWVTNLCALPWGRIFFCSQHSLVAYCSLWRVEASHVGSPLPIPVYAHVSMSIVLSMFSQYLDSHVGQTF